MTKRLILKTIILITFLFIQTFSYCQTFPFNIKFDERNNIIAKIDTPSEFYLLREAKKVEHTIPKPNGKIDSIFRALCSKYKNSILDSAGCIILIGNDTLVALCNDTITSTDPKSQTAFTVDQYINGFIFFHINYYEGE